MKYSIWSIWFTISLIAFIIIAFIGVLPGSVEAFPNWPYYAFFITLNLTISGIVGIYSQTNK